MEEQEKLLQYVKLAAEGLTESVERRGRNGKLSLGEKLIIKGIAKDSFYRAYSNLEASKRNYGAGSLFWTIITIHHPGVIERLRSYGFDIELDGEEKEQFYFGKMIDVLSRKEGD